MRIQNLLLVHLLSILALCVVMPAYGAEMEKLTRLITQKQSSSEVKQQAIIAGQERVLSCSVCHGEDGNSVKPDVTNLASQRDFDWTGWKIVSIQDAAFVINYRAGGNALHLRTNLMSRYFYILVY